MIPGAFPTLKRKCRSFSANFLTAISYGTFCICMKYNSFNHIICIVIIWWMCYLLFDERILKWFPSFWNLWLSLRSLSRHMYSTILFLLSVKTFYDCTVYNVILDNGTCFLKHRFVIPHWEWLTPNKYQRVKKDDSVIYWSGDIDY